MRKEQHLATQPLTDDVPHYCQKCGEHPRTHRHYRAPKLRCQIALVLGLLCCAARNPPQPAVQCHWRLAEQRYRRAYNHQHNTESAVPFQTVQTPASTYLEYTKRDSDKLGQDRNQHNDSWVTVILTWVSGISAQAIFNLVTTAATVFLAIFTGQLVVANRGMQKANERANKLARESLSIAERAYVNVKEVNSVTCEPDKPLEFTLTYINTGRTPAENVEVLVRGIIADEPQGVNDVPEGFDAPNQTLGLRGLHLGAGLSSDTVTHYTYSHDPYYKPLTPELFSRLMKRELVWTVMVIINYLDQSKTHQFTLEFFEYNHIEGRFHSYGVEDWPHFRRDPETRDIRAEPEPTPAKKVRTKKRQKHE